MSTYTIKSIMPTGKESAQFGKEFYIQFNEMSDTPSFWFKKEPQVGGSLDLEQVNGKWKKVKKEWNPNQQSQSPATAQAGASKPAYKDNSDGMRQGMCFNNAAAYVNTLEFVNGALTNAEWAQLVFDYAQALYRLGDLNTPQEGSQQASAFDNTAQLFGGGEKVVQPRAN